MMSKQSRVVIRRAEVQRRTGLSKSAIYKSVHDDGGFPKPIRLTKSAVGWYEDEVSRWLESRPRAAGATGSDGETAEEGRG